MERNWTIEEINFTKKHLSLENLQKINCFYRVIFKTIENIIKLKFYFTQEVPEALKEIWKFKDDYEDKIWHDLLFGD